MTTCPMPRIPRLRLAALFASLASGSAFAATPLPLPPGTGMCAALQAYLQAGRLAELESSAVRGLRIAGHRANVEIRSAGTGLAPYAWVTDADTDEAFEPALGELHGEPRGDGAIVSHGGLHHVLLLAREGAGGYSVALDGGPSCDVEHGRTEQVAPSSIEPQVCQRILHGTAPTEIEFSQPTTISDEALAARWKDRQVTAAGAVSLDIANDGRPVDVVQLQTTLRQPDACTARLWDVLAAHGSRLANDVERGALTKRGIVADDPAGGADCYSETHFLRDGRRVLIESLDHTQSDTAAARARHVEVIEHGVRRGICETASANDWRVTPASPDAAAR